MVDIILNQILDMFNFYLHFLRLMIVIYVQVHFNVYNAETLKYFNLFSKSILKN